MRELKFRIWDKQNKKWITENGHSLHCFSNWSICPFTGKLTDYVGAFDGDHGETYTANPAPDYYLTASGVVKEPRYIVVEYTGLKDKNGKEIYEGDIVKYSRCRIVSIEERKNVFSSKAVEDGDFIGEIIFIFPSFCWSYNHKRYDDIEPMTQAYHRYEVVGSIFETPELLN